MKYECANAYYHISINEIGGIETHLYYLAKTYSEYDLVIFYKYIHQNQLKRLKQYVRCVQLREGDEIECQNLFVTYGMNAKTYSQFKAKTTYYVIHADYLDQIRKKTLPANSTSQDYKVDKYIAVSKVAQNGWDKPSEVVYMPIELDDFDDPIFLVSATRLSIEKGGERMKKLIKILDDNNVNYLWDIYTNAVNLSFNSPNVRVFKPRLDIVSKLKCYDALVQLSDSEAYCVTMQEALLCGLPLITTPFNLINELKPSGVIIPFDVENVDIEAIKNIKSLSQNYTPFKHKWDKLIIKKKSDYVNDMIIVRATDQYTKRHLVDKELGRVPKENEEWIVDRDRLETILDFERRNKCKMVEVVK